MKGIVINLLEAFVSERFGDVMLEEIYEHVKLSEGVPPFIGPLSYPDEDIFNIVFYLSENSGISTDELFHSFGKYILPLFVKKYPVYFENITCAKELLKTVNNVIHVEVKKLFEAATPPVILLEETANGQTLLHYNSPRKMCDLLQGLIDGVSDKFEEKISYRHVECMKNGAKECILELAFLKG